MKALNARNTYSIDGTGVKVGILSDTFNKGSGLATNAATDVAQGNLPGPGNPCGRTTPVNVLDDSVGSGSDEGRAMLQIVHDLAPGATLSFATAFTGLTAFADNIRALRAAGADVIADDVFYFVEPFFQQGPVDVAINDVTAAGARYFTLAGNHNRIVGGNDVGTWEAPAYRPITVRGSGVGGRWASTTAWTSTQVPALTPTEAFSLPAGGSARLNMQYAEPWNGVTTDLDLFVVDAATGTIVYSSEAANLSSQTPYETRVVLERVRGDEELPHRGRPVLRYRHSAGQAHVHAGHERADERRVPGLRRWRHRGSEHLRALRYQHRDLGRRGAVQRLDHSGDLHLARADDDLLRPGERHHGGAADGAGGPEQARRRGH